MVTDITFILEAKFLPENGKLDINTALEESCIQMVIFWKVLGKMANGMVPFISPFKMERNLKAVLLTTPGLVHGQRLSLDIRGTTLLQTLPTTSQGDNRNNHTIMTLFNTVCKNENFFSIEIISLNQ